MTKFKVGIIGTGRPRSESGATGFGMAHMHAAGYEASPDAEIVAACDIKTPTTWRPFAGNTRCHGATPAPTRCWPTRR